MTDTVYQTRLVPSDFNRSESALNHFADPADARTYIEAVLRLRYDAETTAWAREESAGEKWSMHPDGFDGRAVVMGCQVHESADDPIDAVREAVTMLEDDGGVTVFEDGTATTCPDCEGDLQYQTREAIVCLGCGADYVHWKTTAEHQLREVEVETGESETVATAPVEDHELATDGGTNPETGPDGTCWNCEDAAPGALAQISVGPLALTVAVCHDCDEELEDEFASGTEGSSQ